MGGRAGGGATRTERRREVGGDGRVEGVGLCSRETYEGRDSGKGKFRARGGGEG